MMPMNHWFYCRQTYRSPAVTSANSTAVRQMQAPALLLTSSATGLALGLARLKVLVLIPATIVDGNWWRGVRPSMGHDSPHRDCRRHNIAVLLPDRGTSFRGPK